VTFLYILKLLGSSKFQLYLCSSNIQVNSAQHIEASNLSNVFYKYHKFTDVFSKAKAEVFAPEDWIWIGVNSIECIWSLSATFIEKDITLKINKCYP